MDEGKQEGLERATRRRKATHDPSNTDSTGHCQMSCCSSRSKSWTGWEGCTDAQGTKATICSAEMGMLAADDELLHSPDKALSDSQELDERLGQKAEQFMDAVVKVTSFQGGHTVSSAMSLN